MYAFDRAIAVTPDPEVRGYYHAELLAEWCIGQVPHGGYVLAVLLNAMRSHSILHHRDLLQPDPIQLGVAFIVKSQVGGVRVVIEDLKLGRGYSNYRISLQQLEAEGHWTTLVHGLGVMGSFAKETGASVCTTVRTLPNQADCAPVPPVNPHFRLVANHFDFWEHPDHKGIPETEQQWLAFKDQRPMDALAMSLIADLMTPLPVRLIPGERGWYPTLTLDLQFKKAPRIDGMFTYLEVESESIVNGRFDITTRCYDVDHELVVVSRHAAMIVSAARNLAKRGARPKM